MRAELAKRQGLRGSFSATFQRYGERSSHRGPPRRTLLFVEVRDSVGAVVTDHVWFTSAKCWDAYSFTPGDIVRFDGRVREYWKGYRGQRSEADDAPLINRDFKISHPTNVHPIGAAGGVVAGADAPGQGLLSFENG